ncbi:hypothetical protein E3J61_01385 [Candidatus Dependentiae bacterium]|nr:MAG: hypothetical protein E3J61_01385 [Candidatus Dependentiae bacterium]
MKKLLLLILILIPMQSFTMPKGTKGASKKSNGLSPEQKVAIRELRALPVEGNGDERFLLSANKPGGEKAAEGSSERLLRMMGRMEFAFSKFQTQQGNMQQQLDDMRNDQRKTRRILEGLILALHDPDDETGSDKSDS